ncbi:VOC family protein [Amnibacterium sp.]|uniref:VOC family protein n=1 Tax=Amnibacterium sp. TaxID=1872496 RepID=UPI00260F22E9|nr:VOC family protein [Amnibacterium sp.]MCU1472521.1 glyoxalase [Amnibacterium sp.]
MTSRIDAINITCRNHEELGAFWQQVLGLEEDPDDPNNPGDPVTVYVTAPVRIRMYFQPTEPGEEFHRRIHFDVDAVDRTRDEEVDRLIGLGAELVVDRRDDDGSGWVTLRDPDGYELCVQRSAEERAAAE